MKWKLRTKYITSFLISFLPVFLLLNLFIYNYMKSKLFNEKWNSMATLAENSALISEEFLIGTDIDLLSLQQILTNIKKNTGVIETYIINKKNKLIAHQNIEFLRNEKRKRININNNEKMIDQKNSTVYKYKNNYLVRAPIYDTTNFDNKKIIAYLDIVFSKKNILKIINEVLLRTVVLSFLGLLIITILVMIMVTFIIKPIKRLHKGVEKISQGNYDTEVDKTTKDEVGDLTVAFNKMAQNLKEKELVRNMFSKYLSPDIAEYILDNPEELELGGEDRELTIMFTDIRSFTSLSENFPPHDIVKLLNSYFTKMVEIIFNHKGTLDKFLGDGILAIFGAPIHYENHALNSIKAALDMIKYMESYNKDRIGWGLDPIHIGIGINTGDAIIGNIGSQQRAEYTVIGDTVNTASRVEGLTKKNEILISKSTFVKVKEHINYRYMGKMKVKNKKEPLDIFKVLSLKNNE